MTDDLTGINPRNGQKDPSKLRERFLGRLSRMIAARVRLSDHEKDDSVDIFITRNDGSPQTRVELDTELGEFLQHVERSLSIISTNHSSKSTHMFTVLC